MTGWWQKQIDRADQLALQLSGSSELLAFYAQLLRAQSEIYEFLRSRKDWLPSGDVARDLPIIREALPGLLKTVETYGPETLAADARDLSNAPVEVIDEMLVHHWSDPSDIQFFAKAFLQPYGRWLADTGARPGRELG